MDFVRWLFPRVLIAFDLFMLLLMLLDMGDGNGDIILPARHTPEPASAAAVLLMVFLLIGNAFAIMLAFRDGRDA